MLIIHCRKCAAPHLGLGTSIESMHRSAEGLVGYVRCPAGHLVIHHFDEAYPKPDPPASVLELRARLAAEEQTGSDQAVPSQIVLNQPLLNQPLLNQPLLNQPVPEQATSTR